MAIGKKTGGRNFVPGQSGNPKGRKPMDPELKALQRLGKGQLEKVINTYIHMSKEDIADRLITHHLPILDVIVCKILTEAADKGDVLRFNSIIDRLVGKVVEKVETKNVHAFDSLSDEELKEQARELLEDGEGES